MPNVPYGKPATVSNNPSPRRVWFTGKTQAITAAARVPLTRTLTNVKTIADTVLAIGSVLCRDPWGFDRGIGIDYTQPVAGSLGLGNMHEQKGIVVAMSDVQSPDPATDGYGRWVDIVDQSEDIPVLCLTGGTVGITIGTTYLQVVSGSFAAQPVALVSTTGALDASGFAVLAADLEKLLKFGIGLPVEPAINLTPFATNQLLNGTVAGNTAPRLVRCAFNGLVGILRPNF